MSEPVSTVQIEDVLSSIRRLVTEEGRAHSKKAERREPAPRLVLTEALRVGDAELPQEDDGGEGPEVSGRHDLGDLAGDEIEFSLPDNRSGDAAHEDESDDTENNPPWNDPDATLHEAAADAQEQIADDAPDSETGEAAAPIDEPELSDPQVDEAEDDAGLDQESGRETQMNQPAAVHLIDSVETFEPEEEPADQAEEPDTDRSGEQTETADIPEETAAEAVSEPADDKTTQTGPSLSDKIHALEAAIAQTRDQWEPDGDSGDAYAGTPMRAFPWRERRTAADADDPVAPSAGVSTESAPAAGEPDPALAGDDPGGEDTFYDEEALRELVADIVRQELQGALGERITRNVRKLVRREIHRAMTAEKLE